MLRIGLLGCGNIGHIIAQHAEGFIISAVFDKVPEQAEEIAGICHGKARQDFTAFLDADADLIVEAASVGAARVHAKEVLLHHRNLVIMSVGALTDPVFKKELMETAQTQNKKIYIPSGAIFGLDNLKIGQISPITKLLLKTTKNPQVSWPYRPIQETYLLRKSARMHQGVPEKRERVGRDEPCRRTGYRCGTLGGPCGGQKCPRTLYRGQFWRDLY